MMSRNAYSPTRRNPVGVPSAQPYGPYTPYGPYYGYNYGQPIAGFGSPQYSAYYYGGASGEKPCPPGTVEDENGDCVPGYARARNPLGAWANGAGRQPASFYPPYGYGYGQYGYGQFQPPTGFGSRAHEDYYYGGAYGEKPCPPGTAEDENGDCESAYARNPHGGGGGMAHGGGAFHGMPQFSGYNYGYGYPYYPVSGFNSPAYANYYYGGARPSPRCPPGMTWTEDLGCVDMTPQRSKRNPGSCCSACAMQNPDVTCNACAAAAGNPGSVTRKKAPPPRAPKYKYVPKDIKGNCPADCDPGAQAGTDICKCLVSPFVSSSGYASNPSAKARRALTTRRVADRVRRTFESNPGGCGISRVENPGSCCAGCRQ